MTNHDVPTRLRRHVTVVPDGCWLWTGSISRDGYGRVNARAEFGTTLPHRIAWIVANGPIPSGMELDHLCAVRRCVRPDHLEPVTHQVNTDRAWSRRTTCRNGHDIALQVETPGGDRRCLECRRKTNREGMRRRRAAARAAAQGVPA